MREKRVRKNVDYVLNDFSKLSPDQQKQKIIDTFGSLHFKYEGDSLYHLFAKANYQSFFDILSAIKFLNRNGVDINTRNNDGQTFLQCSNKKGNIDFVSGLPLDKMNLNNQDNQGKTILHNLVDEFGSIEGLLVIYKMLVKYVDPTIKDNNGRTFGEQAENKYTFWYNGGELGLKSLKREYYKAHFADFIDKISDDCLENDSFLNSLFNDKNQEYKRVHYWCQENEYASDTEKLEAIEKLFNAGIDPNWFDQNNDSIIIKAIEDRCSKDYILKLIEICIKNGYKVNNLSTIMDRCFYFYTEINDLLDFYILLSKYGYNDSFNSYTDMRQIIRNQGFMKMLDIFFKKSNLNGDNNIYTDDDLLYCIFEVEEIVESSLEVKNDYGMAKLLAQKVVENRGNDINFIEDSVSSKELMNAIKICLDDYVVNVVKPTTKKLDKYSKHY